MAGHNLISDHQTTILHYSQLNYGVPPKTLIFIAIVVVVYVPSSNSIFDWGTQTNGFVLLLEGEGTGFVSRRLICFLYLQSCISMETRGRGIITSKLMIKIEGTIKPSIKPLTLFRLMHVAWASDIWYVTLLTNKKT